MTVHPLTAPSAVRVRRRRATIAALTICLVALLAALAAVVLLVWSPARALTPFAPDAENGVITGSVSIDDDGLPAIDRLDPGLRDAVTPAANAAAQEGIAFEVTSGWRSAAYQEWLFDDAVTTYASEEIAGQFVATPDRSSHVTGRAVDIGGLDAQFWLIEHGARWGLCQIYSNERWHFELATEPGGVCPDLRPDAAG